MTDAPTDYARNIADLASRLLRHLRSPDSDAHQWLLELIQQIDLPFTEVPPPDFVRFVSLLLARATGAVAPLMKDVWPEANENIEATACAAQHFVSHPTEENDLQFFEAATDSFPFGPGDGCLGVDEIGGHDAGGGCRSGAGFLWDVAAEVGHRAVQERLIATVEPWLANR